MMQTLDDDDGNSRRPPSRPENPKYRNQNGFGISFGPDEVPDTSRAQLTNALNAHQAALHVLEFKARPIPSLADMEAELKAPETLDGILKQIKELEEEHIKELEKLYDRHAQHHLQETIDMYRSWDDTQYLDTTDPNLDPRIAQSYKYRDELYRKAQGTDPLLLPISEEYSTFRYSYLVKLTGLRKQYETLKLRLNSLFPMSIAEYRSKNQEVQRRVARFLVVDPIQQDRLMTTFHWASMQVQPLRDEFKRNPVFAAEIRAQAIADQVPGDPRRR